MMQLAENKAIGAYLRELILKHYPSVRKFGEACLKAQGEAVTVERSNQASNRLSQILKGVKGVQLADLVVFSTLLQVSCEEILGAGQRKVPAAHRLTNYAVSFSQEEALWREYLSLETQPILNGDEYGKTVIDYALEHKNYKLLKFLVDNGYIWFVNIEKHAWVTPNFGAGTSIKRVCFGDNGLNPLEHQLWQQVDLRQQMITLAIKHNDLPMLQTLRAREIPPLYTCGVLRVDPFAPYFCADMLAAMAGASDEILEYFSTPFEITDIWGKSRRFLFPFLDRLPPLMKMDHPMLPFVLKNIAAHNRYAKEHLEEAIQSFWEYFTYSSASTQDSLKKEQLRALDFYKESGIVSFNALLKQTKEFLTNIFRVELTAEDCVAKNHLDEINSLYEEILTFLQGKEQRK